METLRISSDLAEFDFAAMHRFLAEDSYWAKGIAPEKVRKAFEHSLPFAGFIGARQVAFGRAVTDLSTFAYLRDITVLQPYRGQGYGRALVQAMLMRLKQEGVPAIMLGTADAHALYEKYGFTRIEGTPNLMIWRQSAA